LAEAMKQAIGIHDTGGVGYISGLSTNDYGVDGKHKNERDK
jgi:hypothetical protein